MNAENVYPSDPFNNSSSAVYVTDNRCKIELLQMQHFNKKNLSHSASDITQQNLLNKSGLSK